jgi:hypothetical protein
VKRAYPPPVRATLGAHDRGSVLLVILFFCLGLAVMTQVTVGVVLCIEQGLLAEKDGRKALAAKEEALAKARARALLDWASGSWEEEGGGSPPLEVTLAETPAAQAWLLETSAAESTNSSLVLSALIERGRDGLDLPLAALVAEEVIAPPGRSTPWLVAGSGSDPARAYLLRTVMTPTLPPLAGSESAGGQPVGPGCLLEPLSVSWRLDEGWREVVESWSRQETAGGSGTGVCWRPTDALVMMSGSPGQTLRPSADTGFLRARGEDPEHPFVLVVSGGAFLDLRHCGELWGVLVVDDGGVELDGTLLHGAVFATRKVDVGWTGTVSYDRAVLRWATDSSLWRARLLPGSRRERLK